MIPILMIINLFDHGLDKLVIILFVHACLQVNVSLDATLDWAIDEKQLIVPL